MQDALIVSEVFGPTLQGEGPEAGRAAMFLRLGGCNLACSWCDTPYTWDWKRYDKHRELTTRTAHSLLEELAAAAPRGVTRLVITGGEPMLQQDAVCELIDRADRRWVTQIETAGTITPSVRTARLIDRWVCSPKLANSGNPRARAIRPESLHALGALGAAFKFVAAAVEDLTEIDALTAQLGLLPHRIWIMPEGTVPGEQLVRAIELLPAILQRGYNLSLRQHVLFWSNARGH